VVATCRNWSPRGHRWGEVDVIPINVRGKQQLKALHQAIRPRGMRSSTQCWMWLDRTSRKPRSMNSRNPPNQVGGRIHAPSVNRRRRRVLLHSIPRRSPFRRQKARYPSVVDRSPVFLFTRRIRGRVVLDRHSFSSSLLHHINESQGVIAFCWSEVTADAMPVTYSYPVVRKFSSSLLSS